jgi:hypothetical protein
MKSQTKIINPKSSLGIDQIDRALIDQDHKLQYVLSNQSADNSSYNIKDSIAYQIEEKIFECPDLEDNPLFQKLRNRLRQFF